MEITKNTQQIEQAEQAYLNHTSKIGPMWGEKEEAEAGRLADELQRLYDEADTPEFDRIVL